MTRLLRIFSLLSLLCFALAPLSVQTFPTDDPVIKNIWKEAKDSSQLMIHAHELFDVVGPRLVGSPQMKKAHDWAVKKYTAWGIEAKNEQWGQWRGWERGVTHIDLLEPRCASLILVGILVDLPPDNPSRSPT